jgi:serine/threonine-protein kinase HipA
MNKALVLVNSMEAGILEKLADDSYKFTYNANYDGAPVSLTMPLNKSVYEFNKFPPFFEGLLPEGNMLQALLRKCKLDKEDYLGQLIKVGHDVVGAITVEGIE